MNSRLRVLLVEDNAGDADLIQEYLSQARQVVFEIECVPRLASAISFLEREQIDVILLDLGLPDSSGLETLSRVLEKSPGKATVVLTGLDEDVIGLEAIRLGAQDYLLKGHLAPELLIRTILHSFERKKTLDALGETAEKLKVQQTELEVQNEDLRQAQVKLEELKDRYLDLYDFAPVGYCTLDRKGIILEANQTAVALLGVERKSLTKIPFSRFGSQEFGDAFYLYLRRVFETRAKQTCEIELSRTDGSHFHAQLESIAVQDENGQYSRCRTIVTDISERKRAEAVQRETEDRYRDLVENIQDLICTHDLQGNLLFVNQASATIVGFSPADLVGTDMRRFLAPEVRDQFDAYLAAIQRDGQASGLMLVQTKSGEKRIWEYRNTLRTEGAGEPIVRGLAHDITESRKAEEYLREAERRYRRLFEQAPLMYVITRNEQGVPLIGDCNELFLTALGYTREEVQGKSLADFYSPESRSDFLAGGGYARALVGEFFIGERHLVRSDGSFVPTLAYSTTEVDPSGRVTGTRAMFVDITELKKAEENLRQSEERNRFLAGVVDRSSQPFATGYPDGRIGIVNRAFCDLTGYSEEELRHIEWNVTLTPPEWRESELQHLIELDHTGKSVRYEKEYIRKDGTRVPIELLVHAVRNETGEPLHYEAFLTDLTERKRAEETLREREEFLSSIVENIPDMIFIKDAKELRFVRFNKAGEELLGYKREDLVGKNDYDFFPKEQADSFRKKDVEVLESGQVYDIPEEPVETKNGRRIIHTKKIPILDKDGVPAYLLGISEDITERKRVEEALKASDKQYRTLFEESIDGVYSVLRDGTITDANPSFCELFGYSKEEMISKNIRELAVDPTDRPRYQKEIEKAGFVKDWEVKLRKRNGTEVDCLITSSVIYGEDRSITGYRGIVRDLTARKELHRQLLQAQKMEAVGTLAGGVAHDFNNLLQVVLGYSELVLTDEHLPPGLRDDLGRVLLAARNGADLVQRLLTFSRKTEIKPLDLDLNQRIGQAQKFLQRTIPKMIDIELILADDLARIHADPTQVDQVLMNLAVNARDAMPEGGRLVIETANVFLDEECEEALLGAKPGQCVLLSVSDTGHGMDKETLGHIFEPFYTTKEAGKGTGLGLAMVYGIVHQHGGYITCYSEPGAGTTFKVYFPAVELEMNPDVATTGIMPAFGTETILLVDDEEFVRDLGKRILERSGYTVLTAANGKEALELYRREMAKISLVILDVIMPEMGGKQCLEELLRIDPKGRVLIASGYSPEGSTKDALQGGAKGFVSKPFDMRRLLQTVRKVLDET